MGPPYHGTSLEPPAILPCIHLHGCLITFSNDDWTVTVCKDLNLCKDRVSLMALAGADSVGCQLDDDA
jgi:hypothetical protein